MNRISVVVPVYNVQPCLSCCLDSLYKQVDETIEVILVNDGSTDNSLAVCQDYAKKHINTIVIDKENGGLSDARNAGTKAATGDYIYYLDSDDWLAPNAIKTLFDYAIENDCEIVQGGFYYAYDDHLLYNSKYKRSFIWDRHEAMLELVKNDYVKNFAWGKLYRTDIVKKHQFPKGKYYEDSYWQHLIVHECNRYGVVPTPLYYYRQRNTGISGEFSLKNLDLLRGYEERLSFVLKNYPEMSKDMVELIWNLGHSMVKMAEKCGNEKISLAYLDYWKFMNKNQHKLFEKSLKQNLRYHIWQRYPVLLPFFDLISRIICKLKPSVMIKLSTC